MQQPTGFPGHLLDREIVSIELMGSHAEIAWKRLANGLTIQAPTTLPELPVVGFRITCK